MQLKQGRRGSEAIKEARNHEKVIGGTTEDSWRSELVGLSYKDRNGVWGWWCLKIKAVEYFMKVIRSEI